MLLVRYYFHKNMVENMTKKNACFMMEDNEHKAARVLAAIEEKSFSELVREAVKEKINKAGGKLNAVL